MGIVDDEDTYFPELTAKEFIWWVGRLRELTDEQCQEQIDHLAKKFFIEKRLNDLISSLSHGMRRKVELAAALIGSPKLLILDEPANGLDVDSVDTLCEILQAHRKNKGTVILACHDPAIIKRICTDKITLKNGAITNHDILPGKDGPDQP